MGSYLKIDPIRLGKFNNAEYTNFMSRTLNQALAAGVEKIGASETLIEGFTANVNKMTDIVAQSRASVETAQIAETDKKADELIVYLMATFRTNLTSPIQAMRTAAETLYLKTKPYVECQTLPQGQQIQKMRGLLSDISTAEMSVHITTLGLTAVVEELNTITTQYSALIEQRTASQLANKLDAGKTVRLELDEQYDDLVTIAFVTSVATPSKEATDFVVYMNKLIADTDTAYNQRIAQRGKKKEETEKE
ncbi:MAG: hypothetical protein IJE78_12530 [Bacteroidaceae bacterium]|nr:hypothetical protein [Bacteroidaceae bacterium]